MYIPSWLIWIIGVTAVLITANAVGKREHDYDFISPLLGLGIILIGIAFAVGYVLGVWK